MGKFFEKLEDGTLKEVEAFTQVEVDGIFKGRLERESKKFADENADLKQKLADVNKSVETITGEKKTLEEQLQSKDKEIEKTKLDVARVSVKHEFGLSDDLEKFLIGDNEEEIRSNAELLKKGGVNAGVTIIKKNNDDGPKESPSEKLAVDIFGSADE